MCLFHGLMIGIMVILWRYDGDCMGIWCNNTITPKNIDPENSWFLDERNFPNQVFLQPPIYLVGSISLFGGWSFTPCHKIEVWICNFSASFGMLLSTITCGHANANDMQWSCQTTYIYTYINITMWHVSSAALHSIFSHACHIEIIGNCRRRHLWAVKSTRIFLQDGLKSNPS